MEALSAGGRIPKGKQVFDGRVITVKIIRRASEQQVIGAGTIS
jgi:hypothetical protein